MRKLSFLSITFLLTSLILALLPVAYCSNVNTGDSFFYDYAVLSSGVAEQSQGEVLFTILSYNQTTLNFKVKSSALSEDLTLTINYEDGIPIYAERLEALLYLPPESLAEILNDNLDWLTNLNTESNFKISSKTSETLNYTVGAGTFQSVNITLSLSVGIEFFGTVNLIYDIDSGVLIYSDWIHEEGGDRTVHVLMDIGLIGSKQSLLFNILSLLTIFFIPLSIMTHQTYSKFKKNPSITKQESQEILEETDFPRKSLYLIFTGAFLNILTFFIPWSIFSNIEIFLPFSPFLIIFNQIEFTNITSNFNLISLLVHLAVLLIWLGIAMRLYFTKNLIYQLMIIFSAILNLMSFILLIQANWSPYLGALINLIGALFVIIGMLTSKLKVEVVTQEPDIS